MKSDIGTRGSDELLRLIRDRRADPDAAGQAYIWLHERHAKLLYEFVRRSASLLVGRGIDPADVVEMTFQRVYLHAADTFKSGTYEDSDATAHVQVWLNRIAKCQLLDAIKSHDAEYHEIPNDDSWLAEVAAKVSGDEESDAVMLVRRIVRVVLSPEEQEIVWFKMQHYRIDTRQSLPPKDELAAFCDRLKITQQALRQRYVRAIAKIREQIIEVRSAS